MSEARMIATPEGTMFKLAVVMVLGTGFALGCEGTGKKLSPSGAKDIEGSTLVVEVPGLTPKEGLAALRRLLKQKGALEVWVAASAVYKPSKIDLKEERRRLSAWLTAGDNAKWIAADPWRIDVFHCLPADKGGPSSVRWFPMRAEGVEGRSADQRRWPYMRHPQAREHFLPIDTRAPAFTEEDLDPDEFVLAKDKRTGEPAVFWTAKPEKLLVDLRPLANSWPSVVILLNRDVRMLLRLSCGLLDVTTIQKDQKKPETPEKQGQAKKLPPFPKNEAKCVIRGKARAGSFLKPLRREGALLPGRRCDPLDLGLPDVFIVVKGLEKRWRFPRQRQVVRLAMIRDRLGPFVVGVGPGTQIGATNEAPQDLEKLYLDRTPTDWLRWSTEQSRGKVLPSAPGLVRAALRSMDTPRIYAKLHYCPHPIHTVTDDHGHFQLPPLPQGEYEVMAVHGVLGRVSKGVTLSKRDRKSLTLVFRVPPALNIPKIAAKLDHIEWDLASLRRKRRQASTALTRREYDEWSGFLQGERRTLLEKTAPKENR